MAGMDLPWMPVSAVLGGGLIGLAATLLFALNGRIAGVSGIAWLALRERGRDGVWRWAFLAGLVAGAALWFGLGPGNDPVRVGFPLPMLILGAFFVGVGTRLGSGCTSGHGICGLARLSPRSLAAVAVFMAAGMATTTVIRHVLA